MDTLTREKVMEKVKKLLALSGSSNVHEAAVAAEAAQRLMFQYKIGMSDIEVQAEEAEPIVDVDILREAGQKQPTRWQVYLLNGVAQANFCRLMVTPSRYGRPGRMRVFGKSADVQAVTYLYRAIVDQIDELVEWWARHQYGATRGERSSFRFGAAVTVSNRLQAARRDEEAKLRQPATTTALARVVKAEAAVQEFIAHAFPHAGHYRCSTTGDRGSFHAGKQAGHSIHLGGGKALGAATPALPR